MLIEVLLIHGNSDLQPDVVWIYNRDTAVNSGFVGGIVVEVLDKIKVYLVHLMLLREVQMTLSMDM